MKALVRAEFRKLITRLWMLLLLLALALTAVTTSAAVAFAGPGPLGFDTGPANAWRSPKVAWHR